MRTPVAIVLLIAGLLVALSGVGYAVLELAGLYNSTIADPLGQAGGGAGGGGEGKDVSRRMFIGVGFGAAGLVSFMIGSMMLKLSLLGKRRKSQAAEVDRVRRVARASGGGKGRRIGRGGG